ncbi:MAG: InlB B-repeat-containing protein [Clostridia bacterium]|nr:InlB B-repeat-containing protein [Clostridia bacterium]
MTKKMKLTSIFAAVATFFIALILSLCLYVKPVKAASERVFEMQYGAGVQLGTGKDGLRFIAKMDKDYYDQIVTNDSAGKVKLYGFIAPVEEFEGITDYKDFIPESNKRVGGVLAEEKIYAGEDGDPYYYANIVITGLAGMNYQNRAFAAVVFIEDTTSGSAVYTYADLMQNGDSVSDLASEYRTQYQIVNAAFLDASKNYETKLLNTYAWFGTEQYPIIIATAEQLTAFESKISANAEFANLVSNKHVFIKENVNETTVDGATNVKTGYVVEYRNGNKLLSQQFVTNVEAAVAPADPTKDGYEFAGWVEDKGTDAGTVTFYAKWKPAKGDVKDLGDTSIYGVTRADGSAIASDSDVIGKKVILASGDLGDGAYFPGETNEVPDRTDENDTADQAYLAYDGEYGFNDYFVADFTGKNMPILAFFANNYNNSIFYGDGTKNGVVVATGFTWPDGRLFTEGASHDGNGPYSTTVWDGHGIAMWGPHMIYNTGYNNNPKGVLLHSNEENVALGRANLESGKKYRIIMGMQPGDDLSNKAIKLVYRLYDLESGEIVEDKAINTYNFFADNWANDNQTRDQFCSGSIVAYGYFGTTTVLDKTYDIFEDTSINAIATELGMLAVDNVTTSGDTITLGAGSISTGCDYIIGQNSDGGTVTQSYYAINGEYSFDDYIVLDFTGKNMPEVMFFAKNYDTTMYYTEGKQGVVVASGITLWDGTTGSAQSNNTKVGVSGPFGAYFVSAAEPYGGNMMSDFDSDLARANLVDGTQYRVVMGITKASDSRAFSLKYMLYNLTDDVVVEEITQTSWNFFSGSNAAVGSLTRDALVGSIVLYGKFGVDCTIDKLHGVYENTTIEAIKAELAFDLKTVTFQNYDGTVIKTVECPAGGVPDYSGETPVRPGDFVYTSYEFAGWDKEFAAVTEDVTYTAVFTGVGERDNITLSGDSTHTYGVEQSNNKIVLKASNLGDGANYITGQNNADGAWVHQSYLAFDGDYALNDYVAFDFTGKNLPEIAFFANNYNDSMYAEGTTKEGIVVVTGITTYDGGLSSVNGSGTQINYGYPFMIQDTSDGGFVEGAFADSALGRANLVDGTHYRVIMGFTGSGKKITLHWYLYNLDTSAVVEESSMTTWGFFSGSNEKVGSKTINDLVGSIVLYGKFGVACELDKVHGVFEDTDIATVADGLNNGTTYTVTFENSDGTVLQEEIFAYGAMPAYTGATPIQASDAVFDYTFAGWDKEISIVSGDVTYTATYEGTAKSGTQISNVTASGDTITLGAGSISTGCNYTQGQNSGGGTIVQSYLALDGEYSFGDYIVLDFTGKNMPEIMFFAKNYDTSMYYTAGKQGVVVASGITLWNGTTGSAQTNNTKVGVSGPFGAYFEGAAEPTGGNMMSDFDGKLARANLEDGKQYRIVMGFKNNGTTFTLEYKLYDIENESFVEEVEQTSWAFFTGSNAAVNNMTLDGLSGSIVLYGKFGTTCTIDKLWGVYEDTTLAEAFLATMPDDDESGSGSGSGSTPEVDTLAWMNEFYGSNTDRFDFYAYSAYSDGTYEIDGQKYYIGKNLANLKQYSQYGEVGMTIYFPQSDMIVDGTAQSLANAKKLIDDLAKVGIHKTILQDSRILYLSMQETAIVGNGCQFADQTALDTYIYECVKDYADYPGVYGIMLGDEPKYSMLSAYAAVYNSIKRVNKDYGFNLFIQYNLNPLNVTQEVYENYYPASSGTYAWKDWRFSLGLASQFDHTVTRYTQYINDFLDAMNPDSIMYDDYPLMENADGDLEIKEEYIPCLQIVAKAAADRGIKFYNVTQAYENNADGTIHRRAVTEKGAKWLNNILLGFGTKQIAYYTYYTRSESDSTGGESYVDGQSFVDYNGNPTALYYTMKDILSDNQIFAKVILQFNYKGSRVYGSTSANHLGEITVSNGFTKLTACSVNTGSALVTELYDEGNNNYMYMAMNVLDPDVAQTSETVTMTFSGYTKALVYSNGEFIDVELSSNVYTATVTPGEAVFVIPHN